MKNIPLPLLETLLSTEGQSLYVADLFTITLKSGLVMRITDGQLAIPAGGQTYDPVRWGAWKCTGTQMSLGMMNSSANLTIYANPEIRMPDWDIPILEAIQLGLFDAASISIVTVYMPTYGDTFLGGVIRFSGKITDLQKTGRTSAEGSAKPDTYTLNQQMPREVLQPGCLWVFGDAGCTIDRDAYTFSNSVGPGTNNVIIQPATPFAQPDDYYTQGVIVFTSGRNNGLAASIQKHQNGGLRLIRPMLFPVVEGDTFNATAGCAHTTNACQQKFDNLRNYLGFPFIPNTEAAIAV